eukprot:8427920-Lingulodinium_polyedra.AAC.2
MVAPGSRGHAVQGPAVPARLATSTSTPARARAVRLPTTQRLLVAPAGRAGTGANHSVGPGKARRRGKLKVDDHGAALQPHMQQHARPGAGVAAQTLRFRESQR